MEALERQADKIRAAKAQGAAGAGAGRGAAEANPEEIDLDMDMGVSVRAAPRTVMKAESVEDAKTAQVHTMSNPAISFGMQHDLYLTKVG